MSITVALVYIFTSYVYSMPTLDGPVKCIIIQDKQGLNYPPVPAFLKNNDEECRQIIPQWQGQKALQCGNSDVYIKPECVCTFHNVWEAVHHDHTACPSSEKSDSVMSLNCSDCEKYSLNNKGPCINGGSLNCNITGNVMAPHIQCDCLPGYTGMFCENHMQKMVRICDRVQNATVFTALQDCDRTKMECVTYSENKQYAYKCSKDAVNSDNFGSTDLPLCGKTEHIMTVVPTSTATTNSTLPSNDLKPVGVQLISGTGELQYSLPILIIASQSSNVLV